MANPALRVLVFVDYYLPGFKGGGPVRSVSRLIASLQGEFDFSLVTRDRDLGDTEPYRDVQAGEWLDREGVRTFYATPRQIDSRTIRRLIREARPDVIYLNSYFSKFSRIVLALRASGRLGNVALLVAPRGEFSPGALRLKALKKSLYLRFASALGLHRRLVWQVSSERERDEMRAVIGGDPRCVVKAPDIALPDTGSEPAGNGKVPGVARFAFVSRISPKKNLLGAIEMLDGIEGDVSLTIYGPIEEVRYAEACEAAIEALPGNVRCRFEGAIPPDEVPSRLANEHFLLFPTFGENFGHVIPEALGAGCPALLSDQTPWMDLEARGAGWVMPLEDRALWHKTIQDCVDMDDETYRRHSGQARGYIRDLAQPGKEREANRRLFDEALAPTLRRAA